MSNEALLQKAKQVISEHRLENVRREIETAKYYFGLIDDKNGFLENLIWMWAPSDWQIYTSSPTKEGKIYEKLAPQGESRTLGNVAKLIRSNYAGVTPEELLTTLQKKSSWFDRHLSFSTHFDPKLLSPLWVRSIREHEKGCCGPSGWQDKLYIEDGNHRSLVYALRILCEAEKFIAVPVLWCKSWKHILCWAEDSGTGESDSPPPALKRYFERYAVDKYLSRFFDN